MNSIDILFIVIIIIGFVIGFFGKAFKKITTLITTIVSVVIAYFSYGVVVNQMKAMDASGIQGINAQPGDTVYVALSNYLQQTITNTGLSVDAKTVMYLVTGIIQVLSFWMMAILLMVVLGIVVGIISSLISIPMKKHTAVKTFGIFGLLNGAIIASIFVLPVVAFGPILQNASEISETLAPAEEATKSSLVINYGGKLLETTNLGFMTYTTDSNETRNFYDDVKSIPGLMKVANIFISSSKEEGKTPQDIILGLSDDEIKDVFNSIEQSDTIKELVVDAFDSILDQAGIDVDLSNVDFSGEADTFIAIKNTLDGDITNEDLDNLTDALCDSEIVKVLAETQGGLLASVPQENKTEIQSTLQAKVANGSLSQDDYDTLMNLFSSGE